MQDNNCLQEGIAASPEHLKKVETSLLHCNSSLKKLQGFKITFLQCCFVWGPRHILRSFGKLPFGILGSQIILERNGPMSLNGRFNNHTNLAFQEKQKNKTKKKPTAILPRDFAFISKWPARWFTSVISFIPDDSQNPYPYWWYKGAVLS